MTQNIIEFVLELSGRSTLNGYGFILLEQPGYNKMTAAPYSQKRQVMEKRIMC